VSPPAVFSRFPTSTNLSPVTYSTTQRPLINFVPLLAYYTAPFRNALPTPAVDYLSLICLNSDLTPASLGSAQTLACHECLRQLCLETREFAKLLGDIRSDGARIPGSIEIRSKLIKLDTHQEFLEAVTLQAAAIADERGQIADAVLLYHLCEDYDNAVNILNQALADAATLDLGESPMQLQPLKPRRQAEDTQSPDGQADASSTVSSLSLTQNTSSPTELAKNMINLYNSNAAYYNRISQSNRKTIGALLQLLTARSHLETSPPRYMDALEGLNALGILPLKAGGSIPAIRAAAATFGSLPPLLARCAGVSVVWAITAIGGERENLAKSGGWDGGYGDDRESMKEMLGSMAKDLMVFAGLVKYKLPARTYDSLTRVGGDVGAY
jgi:nuclear pore complex protein Nup93